MIKASSQNRFLMAFLGLAAVAAILWAVGHYSGAVISPGLMMAVRWAALVAVFGYAWARRSLTTWIFAGMLIGAEIGHDWPQQAVNLQVLSTIFLWLIKTIVAPLIFATLVVGIAGHANLKQVGRMGIKALIYFEVVTTLALFIGLGAINLTKAGVGVHQASNSTESVPTPAKKSVEEIILHIFPENIAKSVANGEVLQIAVFATIFAIGLALVAPEKRAPLITLLESVAEAMFKFT